jgi:hypothetical protein
MVTMATNVYKRRNLSRSHFDPDLLELVSNGRDGRLLAVATGAGYQPRSGGHERCRAALKAPEKSADQVFSIP